MDDNVIADSSPEVEVAVTDGSSSATEFERSLTCAAYEL
jgi:hypothetical protein